MALHELRVISAKNLTEGFHYAGFSVRPLSVWPGLPLLDEHLAQKVVSNGAVEIARK